MVIIFGLEDISLVAKKLLEQTQSKIILLYGEMGVGKTTLVKSVAEVLGSADDVSSPSFSLINEYNLGDGKSLYHFDLYRINDVEEAFNFGIEDYLYSNNWIIIEWPELIKPFLEDDYEEVFLTEISIDRRKLELKKDINI